MAGQAYGKVGVSQHTRHFFEKYVGSSSFFIPTLFVKKKTLYNFGTLLASIFFFKKKREKKNLNTWYLSKNANVQYCFLISTQNLKRD